jgi:hypothetical protein
MRIYFLKLTSPKCLWIKFNGRSKAIQVDTTGDEVFTAESTFQGTRIKVDPLN